MPNHYHLLIKQAGSKDVTDFIRSLSTTYSMHFNKKYDRVGSLFQGKFKAVDIDNENYLLWISRYIHKNPADFKNYPYSSYDDYLLKRSTHWLNTSMLLDIFSSEKNRQTPNYQHFVEDALEDSIDLNQLMLD